MRSHTVVLKGANANLTYDTNGCFPILIISEENVVSVIKNQFVFHYNVTFSTNLNLLVC